jgi:phenylalanine-4-hydroxylase
MMERYGSRMHPSFVDGIRILGLTTRIPRIEDVNARLAHVGWRTVCVNGYIPSSTYVGLLAEGIHPVARFIRQPEHVDFSPAPDMVHDVLGHLPMLFSRAHGDFLRQLAAVMLRAEASDRDQELYEANRAMSSLKCDRTSSPQAVAAAEERAARAQQALAEDATELTHLTRMYLWSVEFGLMREADGVVAVGAGLLSSPTELTLVCEGEAALEPYSLDVIDHDIAFSDLQRRYFVASGYDELRQVLFAYRRKMKAFARRESGRRVRTAVEDGEDDA